MSYRTLPERPVCPTRTCCFAGEPITRARSLVPMGAVADIAAGRERVLGVKTRRHGGRCAGDITEKPPRLTMLVENQRSDDG
jgi:hypothetical protein